MNTPESEPWPRLTHITREDAAKGQLETAIWLWFHDGDASSIHTLAVAAQGILTAVTRDKRAEPSNLAKGLRLQPERLQEWLRNPQNFFKHGNYRGQKNKELVPHVPDMTELILADNAGTFHRLFGFSTPLLDLFLLRYSLSFPKSKVAMEATKVKIVQSIKIEDAQRLGRSEFYDRILPLLEAST